MRHQFRFAVPAKAVIVLIGSVLTAIGLAPVPAIAQTTVTVELRGNNTFAPRDITINVGDTVHWVWISGFHNVESGIIVNGSGVHDSRFRSGDPTATVGTTFDLTFDQAFLDANPVANNLYDYFCVVHASFNMAGTIRVAPRGDLNLDGGIDLSDQKVFTGCVSGPDSATPPGCSSAEASASDIDDDNDVDLRDFAEFQRAFVP